MNADRLLAAYERIADTPEAIPRLRRFILDLAVRGKLVDQDSNDEPASELLKQIAAEKVRLVNRGKLKKPKPLPEIDEQIYDLPPTWNWTRIRQIASDRGQTVPNSSFTYIDVTAITKETGNITHPNILQANDAPSRARKIVRKGDVLYSCVRPYLLNVAVLDDELEPPPIASTAFAILNSHGLVLPRYLWIVLRSSFMIKCVEKHMRGQAYPAINDTDFSLLPFPLSPLAEQHRIVAKVDELMALCDKLEAARTERETTRNRLAAASLARLNAPDLDPTTFQNHAVFALENLTPLTTRPDQIKTLRQTILNLAIRGKLVEQDANDEPASELLDRIALEKARLVRAGEIRKEKKHQPTDGNQGTFQISTSWSWCRLGSLSKVVTSGSRDWAKYYSNEGAVFVRMGNLSKDHYRLRLDNIQRVKAPSEGEGTRTRLEAGDLLISITGDVGMLGLIPENFGEAYINQHTAMVRPMNEMKGRYLPELLRSSFAQEQFNAPQRGIKNSFRLTDITQFLVPLPPLAEQHRIVAKVDELMALCDRLEESLTTGDYARRRLLETVLHNALAPNAEPKAAREDNSATHLSIVRSDAIEPWSLGPRMNRRH